MTDLERLLRDLDTAPNADLERRTLITAGAADQVVRADSPIGDVWIAWSPRGITGLIPRFAADTIEAFLEAHRRTAYGADALPSDLADAIDRGLSEGETVGLPIDYSGIAPFQVSVLRTCASIPPGVVRPYGWIADEIHNPGSVRAVGTALGRNPIPLLVPCHRVVRSDGSVGNYAFGPDIKHQLLVREGAILA
ncbi:MAG: methylated-DNA--[protein]-cysteine S-methyltransferase [Acidimicrobiia bacterium]|nr:methylated-DNA--[protein]-cysteine S-methyltransferase [Acidimicrobiia bacterium]